MARTDTLPHFLTDVADAIRSKTGNSNLITASSFDTAITNIPSGGEHTGAYKVNSISEMNNIDDMQTGDYCVIENNIEGYTIIEYIQSSGTQYIDTNYKPNNNTRLIFEFEMINKVNSWLCGTRNGTASGGGKFALIYNLVDNIDRVRSDYGSQDGQSFQISNGKHTIDKNKNVTYLDNTLMQTLTTSTFSSTYSMALFTMKNNNGYDSGKSSIKLYSCKIYDNNTLVRDFVPCYRNNDNVIGLYDLANEVFYTNDGTGAFTGGNETTSYVVYQYNGTNWVAV